MLQSILVFIATSLIGSLLALTGKAIVNAKAQREATKSLLRTEMVKAYYKYRTTKKMPHHVKTAWYNNFEAYRKLKGNSFVMDLKKEVDEWDIE